MQIDLEDLHRFHNALPNFIGLLDDVIDRIATIQETVPPTLQQAVDLQDAAAVGRTNC